MDRTNNVKPPILRQKFNIMTPGLQIHHPFYRRKRIKSARRQSMHFSRWIQTAVGLLCDADN